jgi:hypothetical protein
MSEPNIPDMILMAQKVNRHALLRGQPPLGCLAIHEDGLPDDLVLLDEPVLIWADVHGIRRPNRNPSDKRRFHTEILDAVYEYFKDKK